MNRPITWQTIKSDLAGVGRAVNDSFQQGSTNITNALKGFGQMYEDGVKREQSAFLSDFDATLQGYTDPAALQQNRAALLEQINNNNTLTAEQKMQTRGRVDSQISTLQGRAESQWKFDAALANEQRKPLQDDLNTMMANRDFAGAETYLTANQEALGPEYAAYKTKLNAVRDQTKVLEMTNGNYFNNTQDNIVGLSNEEQEMYKQYRAGSLPPDQVSKLEAVLQKVAPLNTSEARLQQRKDEGMKALEYASPELQQRFLDDVEQDYALYGKLPQEAQQQLDLFTKQDAEKRNLGTNVYAQAASGAEMFTNKDSIFGVFKEYFDLTDADVNQTQISDIQDVLVGLMNKGIVTGIDPETKEDVYTRVPITRQIVEQAISHYNSEWTGKDFSEKAFKDSFLSRANLAGQYQDYSTHLEATKQVKNAAMKTYGVRTVNAAAEALTNIRNARTTATATPAPTDAAPGPQPGAGPTPNPEPAPAPASLEQPKTIADNLRAMAQQELDQADQLKATTIGRNLRGIGVSTDVYAAGMARRNAEDMQDLAANLEKWENRVIKRAGIDADALQAIREKYLATGEIDYPAKYDNKLNQKGFKRNLDKINELYQEASEYQRKAQKK